MVKADSKFNSIEDLWKSDSTVAMEAGLPYLKFLNRKYPGSKVKIVPTGTGLAAFERGAVQGQQCFISAEPVQMELKKVPVRVFSLAVSGYDPYVELVVTKRSWLEAHRAEAAKFVNALREGWIRYQAEPAKYNPGIAKLNPAMSLEAMDMAARKQHDMVMLPGSAPADVGRRFPRTSWSSAPSRKRRSRRTPCSGTRRSEACQHERGEHSRRRHEVRVGPVDGGRVFRLAHAEVEDDPRGLAGEVAGGRCGERGKVDAVGGVAASRSEDRELGVKVEPLRDEETERAPSGRECVLAGVARQQAGIGCVESGAIP
jgi:hypothetical protein